MDISEIHTILKAIADTIYNFEDLKYYDYQLVEYRNSEPIYYSANSFISANLKISSDQVNSLLLSPDKYKLSDIYNILILSFDSITNLETMDNGYSVDSLYKKFETMIEENLCICSDDIKPVIKRLERMVKIENILNNI